MRARCLPCGIAALSLLACASPVQQASYDRVAAQVRLPPRPASGGPPPACEVTLQMQHPGPQRGALPIIGSERLCIKRAGSPMAIPGRVRLVLRDLFFVRRVCENERSENKTDGTAECIWNRHFRDEWPFDFVLATTDPTKPLSRYVQMIRVFRNGSLIFSWNGGSDTPSIDASHGLRIAGQSLTARLMPHLADFDLRIVPVDVVIDDSVRSARTVSLTDPIKQQLSMAFSAVRDDVLADPAVKKDWSCFQARMKTLAHFASTLSGGGAVIPLPKAPDGCELPVIAQQASLSELYDQLKARAIDSADQLDRKVDATVGAGSREISQKAGQLLEEFKGSPALERMKAQDAALLLRDADTVFEGVAKLADQTVALHDDLRKTAIRISNSSAEQAKLFQAVHDSLGEKELFVARTPNPAALFGELTLDMKYDDRFQFYLLAPWNGVPVRVSGSNPGASSLGWENAIPIIDLTGARYQWAASRFADVRLALGGMLVPDDLKPLDATGAPMLDAPSRKVFNWAVQGNVNIGGLRVGVAFVTSNHEHLIRSDADRWRVLVGADLLKLLTGTNIEAVAF